MPFVIGLNHESAPVGLREKVAVPSHQLGDILRRWKEQSHSEELVCLSTCNRTEVYAQAKDESGTRDMLQQIFVSHGGDAALGRHLYVRENEDAVRHLFSVASGLDSMVKGEHEILAQVKQAYQVAQQGGFTGKLLNVLFQRSLYVGKRVRTETGLSEGSASVGSVAVGMAERIFGALSTRQIMILGAGEIAEITAKHLLAHNAKSIMVANRTFDRACEVAKAIGGSALHFQEGLEKMVEVDIVICSTASPRSIVTPEHIRQIMSARKGRALFLIDIAMPRDVDPRVNDIENVYLYNIDDLQQIVNTNESKRTIEAESARQIVYQETQEFVRWLDAYKLGTPTGFKHMSSRS